MVSVVTGASLGVERTSGYVLGSRGQLGTGGFGRYGENVTVNAATGNLFISRTDEILIGRGPDSIIGRSYNSLGTGTDDNGDNWQLGAQRRVAGLTGTVNTAGSTITRYDWDGSSSIYSWDASVSVYVGKDGAGSYDRLTFASNVWTWTDGDSRVVEQYDHLSSGRITATTDTDGNGLTYSYLDPTGLRLARVTTASGEYTDLVWSGNNLTQVITAKSGGTTLTRTLYSYDTLNRLQTVTTDLTPDDRNLDDGKKVVTTYTYDGTSDRIASISQTGGAQLSIGYTLVGSTYRVTSYTQTLASGVTSVTTLDYDPTNPITTITDDLGQVTRLTYDATSRQLRKLELPPAQGAAAQIIQYDYNNNGDVISQTVIISQTDTAGKVTTYAYDGNGNLVDRADPDGTHTLYSYDAANQLTKSTIVPNLTGLTTLPTLGVDVEYYLATYGDILAAGTNFDPIRHALNSGWSEGRNPNALFNTNYYLAQNPDVAAAGGNPLVHYLTYGWREGRAPSSTGTTAEFIARYVNQTTRYVYDSKQHLRFMVSPEGKVTEYKYNAAGQQTSVVDYPQKSYNVGSLASSATLSEATMVAWVTGLGDLTGSERSDTSYDFRGNISTIKTYGTTNSAGAGAGTVKTVTYSYDQFGNLLTRQTSGVTNGETFLYDGLGRVTSAIDLNGGTTSTVFTDGSNQQIVTLANGLVQTSVYDLAGNLVSYQTSGTGLTTGKVTYSYDDLGRLRSVTYVDNPGDSTPAIVSNYYLYDAVGRKVADIATDGSITEYGYDTRDRLITTTVYSSRLSGTALASLVDANGRPANISLASVRPTEAADDQWEWRVYDDKNRLIEAIDGSGAVNTFTYDVLGNLVATKTYYNKFVSALTTFKNTPPTAPIVPIAHANDAVTRYFYDNDGNLIGTLDALGYLTQHRYDDAGRKIWTISYADLSGASTRANGTFEQVQASIALNARDIKTFNVYDASGRIQYTLDANLRPTQFVYDSAGNVIQTVEYGASIASGSSYSIAYVAAQISNLGLASHAVTRTSWSVYDAAGRKAYAIDPMGGVTAFAYDNMGQVTKAVQYLTARATTSQPNLSEMNSWASSNSNSTDDRVTRYFYDARGQQRYVVDAAGFVTRNDYDLDGRVTATYRFDTAYSATDATSYATINGASLGSSAATVFAYDPLGRLSTTTDGTGSVTKLVYDAFDQVTDRTIAFGTSDASTIHYTYDNAGNILTETSGYGTSDASTITYAYDGFGNVITRKNGRNYTTTYRYDSLRQILSVIVPIDGPNTAVTSYAYDGFGNVIQTTDPNGNISYSTYDKLNRLIWQVDGEGYATATSYTVGNEVASITRYTTRATASGAAIVPTVPASSGEDATTNFTRDKLGQVTRVTDALGNYEQYTLNAFGDRITVRNKLGGITQNGFDRRGLLTAETLQMNSYTSTGVLQTSSVRNEYKYNAAGNLIEKKEAVGLAEERVTSFEYDKVGRLTKTIRPSLNVAGDSSLAPASSMAQQEIIIYDKRGNVIEQKSAAGARILFFYDSLGLKTGELRATIDNSAGTLSTWSYDKNGNILSAKVYDGNVTLPTSAGGALSALSLPASWRETTFSYDQSNRLVTSTLSSVRTGYWNGSSYVMTTSGNVTSTNYYDAAGNITRQTDGRGGDSWFYYDKLGRKVAQVDQGKYLTSYTLDADGNVTQEERFATALSATLSTSSNPVALANGVRNSEVDRVTSFTYDRNGNRLTESRLNVSYRTVGSTGTLSGVLPPGTATVRYQYNGLGQVVKKIEATGLDISDANNPNNWTESLSYNYDLMGRLESEISSAREHFAGPTMRHTQVYNYDGLNQVVRSVENSERETRYEYDKAGHLTKLRDAAGLEHFYDYDVAGNMVRERYNRVNSAGVGQWEAKETRYDAAGRTIAQSVRLWNGSAWQAAATETRISYNAFGEVTGKGIAGDGATRYYETYDYDKAGRIWRSTAGDGVTKLFLYDQNGNQSALITSSGGTLDWSTLTTDQAVALLTNNGASALGTISVQGMIVTITAYDLRGQATETREVLRETTVVGTNLRDFIDRRVYNAFGEVIQEIDVRKHPWATGSNGEDIIMSYVTDYSYNTLGKVVERKSPEVEWTNEKGVVAIARPTELYHYDLSGRLVAVQDANGNVNTRTLLSGSGYGGEEALVLKEFHADGGVYKRDYDLYGNVIVTTNEVGQMDWYSYDGLDRLTQHMAQLRSDGKQLTDRYTYDILGNRLTHSNSQLGYSVLETTDYDALGRVVKSVDFAQGVTSYAYSWNADAATSGLGTIGGWRRDTTNSAGRTSFDLTNYFGQMVDSQDFGGHNFDYTYDTANRLITTSNAADPGFSITTAYYNSGRIRQSVKSSDNGFDKTTSTDSFTYDENGNRTRERHEVTGYRVYFATNTVQSLTNVVSQDLTVHYDALNRMYTAFQTAGATSVDVYINWEYDKAGNVRRSKARYHQLDSQGDSVGTYTDQDYWYRYDNMNRFVTTKGVLQGANASGQIVYGDAARGLANAVIARGTNGGVDLSYDAAGRRKTALSTTIETAMVDDPNYQPSPYDPPTQSLYWDYSHDRREEYSYSEDGFLKDVKIAQTSWINNGDGTISVQAPPSTGTLRASYLRDEMGRVTNYSEYAENGSTVLYQRIATFNNRNEVTSDTVITRLSNGVESKSITNYWYDSNRNGTGTYMGGVVTSSIARNYEGSSLKSTVTTSNYYGWWDDAQKTSETIFTDFVSGTDTNFNCKRPALGVLRLPALLARESR